MSVCIFCKIRDHEIPKEFDYEDEDVMVFPDIRPLKPVHMLVIPKKHLKDFLELEESDLVIKIQKILQKVVKDQGLEKKGFRISTNGGGAQVIDHLHFHILGPMGNTEP